MKSRYFIIFITVFFISSANVVFCGENQKNNLKFIENKGQWEKNILYKSTLKNGFAFLENQGITILLSENRTKCQHGLNENEDSQLNHKKEFLNNHCFKIKLLNSKSPKSIIQNNRTKEYYNYYLGNDKSKWANMAYGYTKLLYEEVYHNIDWMIYSNDFNLKHDFIVHKGGRVEDIMLNYEGIDIIKIRKGDIVFQTSVGEIVEVKPFAYQIIDGTQVEISAEFVLKDKTITYKIGNYNPDHDLIIDPTFIFSTYSGSLSDNWGFTATYDKEGNAYLGGIVNGGEYPTTIGAFQTSFAGGQWDVSISKFSPDGKTLIFSTYMGGSSGEMPHSLIVNEFNELIVFGTTGSSNFPITPNAFQQTFKGGDSTAYDQAIVLRQGSDIYVSKFSIDGTSLLASTYVGGTKNDGINFKNRYNSSSILYSGNDSLYCNYGDGARGELITDDLNNIYVGSCTFSNDFPTTSNSFQPYSAGGQEGVVFKLDNSLSTMLFSSYIGGTNDDAVYSIDTDKEYRLYVAGGTVSHNFPTSAGAYSTSFNGGTTDGFVSLISYNGDRIIASTYFGSNKQDQAYFVRTDKENNPHIFGQTHALGSSLVYNATYNHPNTGQFIAKFTPNLQTRIWSTVFGASNNGKPNISPSAFNVDVCGRIYISGWGSMGELSTRNLETTPDAYSRTTDGGDFYIMSMSSDASSLEFATFFGALDVDDHVDGGTSRYDKFSTIYQAACAGCGASQAFPTFPIDVHSITNNSNNCNSAVFKINIHDDFAVAEFDYPHVGCAPQTINFINYGRGTTYLWSFGDGTTSTQKNPTHTFTVGGFYDIRLIAYMAGGCVSSDTITHRILVLGNSSRSIDTIYTCPNIPIQIGIPPISTQGITMTWQPEHLITDASISNPFAIISEPTDFYLIISDGNCTDTIFQRVEIDYINIDLPDSITTCNSPYNLVVDYRNYSSYKFSNSSNFLNLINQDTSSNEVNVYLMESQYVYIRVEQDGCFGIDSVWINFTGTGLEIQKTDILCYGDENGTATAIINGGISPHYYEWSNNVSGTVSTINNLIPGNYSLTITDDRGCKSTQSFIIENPNQLNFSFTKTNNPCEGICIAEITLNPNGGVAPYSILWSNASTSFSLNNLCTSLYTFTITDKNNCQLNDTIQILNDSNFVTVITKKDLNCIEASKGEATANVAGGTEPYLYSWSNGEETKKITDLSIGDYWVITTDQYGCKSYDTVTLINKDILKDFEMGASDTEIYDGQPITLFCTDIEGISYQWSPPTYVSRPNQPTTIAIPLTSITYQIFATDNNGCNFTDSIRIKVEIINCGEPNIFIPNIFTPNSDGKNDEIRVTGEHIEQIEFLIFDRWGELVFSSKNPNEAWDGTFRGKDCQAGVYYYRFKVQCGKGREYIKSGDITLIR
ncbi:MAG: gliding motility-associated C-terminal domain-containing protein [Bacteroidales bacterium]